MCADYFYSPKAMVRLMKFKATAGRRKCIFCRTGTPTKEVINVIAICRPTLYIINIIMSILLREGEKR